MLSPSPVAAPATCRAQPLSDAAPAAAPAAERARKRRRLTGAPAWECMNYPLSSLRWMTGVGGHATGWMRRANVSGTGCCAVSRSFRLRARHVKRHDELSKTVGPPGAGGSGGYGAGQNGNRLSEPAPWGVTLLRKSQ